jgi:rubrerythrin
MAESFNPGVVIDGQTFNPPGWMWVMAFAMRGVEWAVEAASKPEFLEVVQAYMREQNLWRLQREAEEKARQFARFADEHQKEIDHIEALIENQRRNLALRNPALCWRVRCEKFVGLDSPCILVHFKCSGPESLPTAGMSEWRCRECGKVFNMPGDCPYVTEMVMVQGVAR